MSDPQVVFDVECYPNYFLLKFRTQLGVTFGFELSDRCQLDKAGIRRVFASQGIEFVSFNGMNYDVPMIALALAGATNTELFEASNDIIENNIKGWQFFKQYRLPDLIFNHLDLIEVAPGMVGLKVYAGRLHCQELEDLPFPVGTFLSFDQMDHVDRYCGKDLKNTQALAKDLTPQINLRRMLSEQYGVDMRSKSDAQIAEAVLKAEVFHMTGLAVKKLPLNYKQFFYEPPAYIRFHTPVLQEVLKTITSERMVIKETGHVELPKSLEKLVIMIDGVSYKIGIGGLHSQEASVAYHTTDTHVLSEWDVTSYYPNLMLNMGMEPPAFHGKFSVIYRDILDRRVAAKHAGDDITADLLKISINGAFGKTSSKYSILYDPRQMIATTIGGQLSILMLIEWLSLRKIQVVSANTDGIVVNCAREKVEEMTKIVAHWEKVTGLNMEGGEYSHLYSRDVNNYIGITPKGKVKVKGIFGRSGVRKSPNNDICSEAVVKFVTDGTPVEETISACTDIRKFLTLRTVSPAAYKEGYALGKVVRWYHSTDVDGCITYADCGDKVPCSDRSRPLMNLPDEFPTDVDIRRYIRIARKLLVKIGAAHLPTLEKMPRRNTKVWKALYAEGRIIEDEDDDQKWMWREEFDFYNRSV